MEKIRLIACDLDRTLLRDNKTLSPYTLSILERCRTAGILFFPATARPPRALEGWIPELSYDGALCHNGGVAVFHGEIIWERGIAPGMALSLLQRLQKELPGIALSAEIGGELYANFDLGVLWKGIPYHFTDFLSLPDHPAEKLIIGLDSSERLRIVKELLPPELYAQISDNKIIMIQPKDITKGAGLLALCEKLGISPSETVGFGDDWNDISLLQASGIGVAVENALPEVCAAADDICPSNEEDGPAHWLEEFILNKK